MNPKDISIADFNYLLPEEKIARFPLPSRDQSRLLILQNQTISEDVFANITTHLPPGSLIVFNDTRVVHARLLFHKPTGGRIEILCLEPDERYPDTTSAFAQTRHVYWKCLVGNAAAWSPSLTLEKNTGDINLQATLVSREHDHFIIHLSWSPPHHTFSDVLDIAGSVPLPPYIKRKPESTDHHRYQTVYAHQPGSVAAPTAGLHFTPEVISKLDEKNIIRAYITLHVGAGTFKPVKSGRIGDHDMHAEYIEVDRPLIETLLNNINRSVIAVGTTSMRTLESLYWIGANINRDPSIAASNLHVRQWLPYEQPSSLAPAEALLSILGWMDRNHTDHLITKTSLMIVPGYEFRIVSVLITNFHQPKSTLLLLVAAFAGKKWESAYTYALEHEFRFLSYGDSCLFFRQ